MEIEWTVTKEENETLLLKSFLKQQHISKRILSKVKFQGGSLKVNDQAVRVREELNQGDRVSLVLPKEDGSQQLNSSHENLDIIYEDEHYIFINKISNVASVPSSLYPDHTVANRIKGYIERKDYFHQTIHTVSRLDKDTSGVMIFAKHTLAHSFMDQLFKEKKVYKEYIAFAEGTIESLHGLIDEPITRAEDSIIKREVHPDGKVSRTEYWVMDRFEKATKIKIQLHTGRTHQIRVHFAHIGHPLLGDSLYGNEKQELIKRQALHCHKIRFMHPFFKKEVTVHAPLPQDMEQLQLTLKK
ncbi:RluA family pseudouridine synthase [Alkalibacterium olivapovliticus]|uniref:Pseudouridine synthase n=1 Tax=Alkalibacterium olivapovliticus TaxID=99907 RepID=A0A2T0WBA6_9LACT|nr:RluA family pseudouridine synthase [Alkalibacterium olivapovliticus]PRY83982.1 23S rRNA pseudouridine1911/1915/1917 synthase [Alkalibacterium olivapovliticus]